MQLEFYRDAPRIRRVIRENDCHRPTKKYSRDELTGHGTESGAIVRSNRGTEFGHFWAARDGIRPNRPARRCVGARRVIACGGNPEILGKSAAFRHRHRGARNGHTSPPSHWSRIFRSLRSRRIRRDARTRTAVATNTARTTLRCTRVRSVRVYGCAHTTVVCITRRIRRGTHAAVRRTTTGRPLTPRSGTRFTRVSARKTHC